MNVVRITKEFTFEMAHALSEHNGKCSNIHGHSYQLAVTVKGKPCSKPDDPESGMVMDFARLKQIVKEEIIEPLDHAFVVSRYDRRFTGLSGKIKVVEVPYHPTCENMIIDFASRLSKHITGTCRLEKLMLRETGTSYAEWHAGDNPSPEREKPAMLKTEYQS